MPKRSSSKAAQKPKKAEAAELANQKREFIETFFKRGAEFAEELMRENERLRFRVAELEQAQAPQVPSTRPPKRGLDPATLAQRLEALEQEREALLTRFAGVERLNHDYVSRYAEIERENNNLANLYVASHQLHSTLELREVTQTIVEILLNFIGAKTFAVQLIDEDKGVLRTLAAEGVERSRVPERSLAGPSRGAGDDHVRQVVQSGRPFFTNGPLEARPVSAPPSITVPLKIGDKVVGLIVVWELLSQKPGLVDVDFELFNLLGDHAGAALQGAKLNTELEGRPPALWGAADLV